MRLNNSLLKHQQEAVDKLTRLRVGALFMEQGTGKTITVLEIARKRYEAGKIDSVIWLCPCSAKNNIKEEIVKHCPLDMFFLFTICGIETLSTSIRANEYLLRLTREKSSFLVVDESLLVKNPRAYRTANILRIAENCPYRIILNGTPISRNEADLYAQFYLLDWRILGYRSYWSFSANHLEYDDYGKIRRVLNTDYLAQKIAPYTFQILKKDCISLPTKKYHTYGFSLTREQDQEYSHAADVLLAGLDERKPETIYRLFSGLQAIMSGKRLIFETANHFKSVEMFDNPKDNPRIQALIDILTDEKTIIFCRYESEISQLCSLLPESARFDGNTSQKARNLALQEFSREKKYLIANKNCAGFSLNLQFCHRIIYMSNDWELGKRLQSEDRVHRIGQTQIVDITDIFAFNTLDERILSCLRRKESLLDSIKREIDDAGDLKSNLKKAVYGARYKHELFDCSELEEKDAEDIQKHRCL